jgi:hypothetical protein
MKNKRKEHPHTKVPSHPKTCTAGNVIHALVILGRISTSTSPIYIISSVLSEDVHTVTNKYLVTESQSFGRFKNNHERHSDLLDTVTERIQGERDFKEGESEGRRDCREEHDRVEGEALALSRVASN